MHTTLDEYPEPEHFKKAGRALSVMGGSIAEQDAVAPLEIPGTSDIAGAGGDREPHQQPRPFQPR